MTWLEVRLGALGIARRVLRVREEDVTPPRLRVVLWALFPLASVLWWGGGAYNPGTDCYRLEGVSISRTAFRTLMTPGGPWLRCVSQVRRPDGTVTAVLELRHERLEAGVN